MNGLAIGSIFGPALMLLTVSQAYGENRRDSQSASTSAESRSTEARPWSIGVRGFGPLSSDDPLGGGIDVAGSIVPHFAVGLQYISFLFDQGADPHYCARCVYNGASALAFIEGRYWPDSWLSPYGRLGAGVAYGKGQSAERKPHQELNLAGLAEVGLEFHPSWFSLRAFGFQHYAVASTFDDHAFPGIGLQLGGRL